jgi:acetyltransferase
MQAMEHDVSQLAAAVADEGSVRVRALHRGDLAALQRFHRRLRSKSDLLRFPLLRPDLTARDLASFAVVDHHQREGVVAEVAGELVAVGRLVHLPCTDLAEVGVAVLDGWEGSGVGRRVLDRLVERARAEGLQGLVAEALPDDPAAIRRYRASGLPNHVRKGERVLHVELSLREPAC